VHEARQSALEELALAEDLAGLAHRAPGEVPSAVHRAPEADEPCEQTGAPSSEPSGDGQQEQ
jgi:hypothetical protein